MNAELLLELVRKATGVDARCREEGADEIADLVSACSGEQAATLATVLSSAAACEGSEKVLEAQLHAILELASTGSVTAGHVEHLRQVEQEHFSEEIRGYIADLLEM